MSDDFKIGEKVIIIPNSHNMLSHKEGFIRHLSNSCASLEVIDFHKGHSCDDRCKQGQGIYIDLKYLKHSKITNWEARICQHQNSK